MVQLPTGTVTFLFTDIAGSTQLLQQLGDSYAAVLGEHQAMLRAAFAAHGGVEVNTQGDAFFVAFASAPAAVAAAADATRDLAAHPWPESAPLRVRMGLHTGTPQMVGDHCVGLDVHRAARIAAAGHGGQVLLSQTVYDQVVQTLPPGVTLRELGLYRHKDLQSRRAGMSWNAARSEATTAPGVARPACMPTAGHCTCRVLYVSLEYHCETRSCALECVRSQSESATRMKWPTTGGVRMRLETARLVIRSFEPHDAEPWIALVNDPEVGRFTPPSPPATLETFQGVLARRLTMERERGYAMWAVEVTATDLFIGQCGLYPAEGKGPEVELAYHYVPTTWGHGYATEAAIAVLTYAFGSVGLDQVIALVMPENVGSWRVAEKAGMRFEGLATYYDLPGLRKYVADRAWWRAPQPG
jgi:RimJ/RimL family protein N-acetyltransferase